MVYGPFQPTQRAFVKHILVLFVIILTLIPVVKAEDKSWYEIDGIRFRLVGFFENKIVTYMPWKIENRISPYFREPINTAAIAGNYQRKNIFPLALELPETLMTSWSFRGFLLEFKFQSEAKDLFPGFDKSNLKNGDIKQSFEYRTSLYNNFFNVSDKAFADANSNWACPAPSIWSTF